MREGTCKYFNGDFHNKTCMVGVCYKDVTTRPDEPGSAFRKACNSKLHWANPSPEQVAEFEARGKCDKYTEPTKEEIKKHDDEMEAHMQKFILATPVIKKVKEANRGKNWKGVVECPACKGKLHMTHAAYNGHVHGKCETENCLAWME